MQMVIRLANSVPSEQFQQIAKELNLVVVPMHPGSNEDNLSRYFSTQISSVSASQIATRLRECPQVEAAYFKPNAEMP